MGIAYLLKEFTTTGPGAKVESTQDTPRPKEQPKKNYYEQATAPVAGSTEYKREGVVPSLPEKARETFKLTDRAEKTLAKSVSDVYTVFSKEYDRGAASRLTGWQKEMVELFRSKYPNLKTEEIGVKAKEFVQTGEGLVFGLKLIEWEQAVLQLACHADVESTEKVNHRRENVVQINYPATLSDTEKAQISKRRKPEDRSIGIRIKFEKQGKQFVVTDTQGHNIGADLLLESRFGRTGIVYSEADVRNVLDGVIDDKGSRVGGVVSDLQELVHARIDILSALGKRQGIQLSLIEKVGNNYQYISGYSRGSHAFLQIEHEVDTRGSGLRANANAEQIIARQLRTLEARMAANTTAKLQEEQRKSAEQQEKNVVNKMIEVLKAPVVPKEADIVERERLQKEITDSEEKRGLAKQYEDARKRWEEKSRRLDEFRAGFPGPDPRVRVNPPDMPDRSVGYYDAKEQLREAKNTQTRLNEELNNIRASNEKIMTRDKEGNAAQLPPEVVALIQARTDRENTIFAELGTASAVISDAQRQMEIFDAVIGKEILEEYETLSHEVLRIDGEMARFRQAHSDFQFNPDHSLDDNFTSKHFGDIVENDSRVLERIGKPDTYRERQVDVYEAYRDQAIPKFDGIQSRLAHHLQGAADPVFQVDLSIAERYYTNYPPAYIRTMQIMFGVDIVMPNRAEDFAKFSKLLTPRIFVEAMTGGLMGPPVSPDYEYDDILAFNNPNADITRTTIDTILNMMKTKALNGTLGETDVVIRGVLDNIDLAAAVNLTFSDPVRDAVNIGFITAPAVAAIYHYEDINDLARRIIDRVPGTSNENAKAYAVEIDRRRRGS